MGIERDSVIKAKRRRELLEKISALYQKISNARNIMSELSSCKRAITGGTDNWESSYQAFQAAPITAEVFVTDLFEGNAAKLLSIEVPAAAKQMNNTTGQMETLCSHIQNQIDKLEGYIARLHAQITELQAQLNTL